MTPEFEAYRKQLRLFALPLRLMGLALILVGAGLLVASKGDADMTLRTAGFVMLGLGWGVWGYVVYARTRWVKHNPFMGPRE